MNCTKCGWPLMVGGRCGCNEVTQAPEVAVWQLHPAQKRCLELEQENAKLREELEAVKQDRDSESKWAAEYKQHADAVESELDKWKQRAEAAEARIREAEKQEPCGTYTVRLFHGHLVNTEFQPSIDFDEGTHELYARPIPSPDVAELRAQLEAAQSQVKALRDALDTPPRPIHSPLGSSEFPEAAA